jgi:perosamine synthetase
MKIQLGRPFLGGEEEQAVFDVMESRLIATGETTKLFENSLASKFKRKYCVSVNSGTSALYLGLKALRLTQVIIPVLTCNTVLYAVLNAGAKPIFADVAADTHNIDLSTVPEEQLSRAEGVIVTHAYGHSADMEQLRYYLEKHHLILIEDFSQATGGYYADKILGSFGTVSTTSFYGPKMMTTGHGGVILTDDPEIYRCCLYGRGDQLSYHYSDLIPMNLRITDIQSAIGLVQLNKLDEMIEMRRRVAHRFNELFLKSDIKLPVEAPGVRHTYYKYHIVLPDYINKPEFIKEMKRNGISAGVLYEPPLHKTWLARNRLNTEVQLPVSEYLAPRTVSLPLYPELNDDEVSEIGRVTRNLVEQCRTKVETPKGGK